MKTCITCKHWEADTGQPHYSDYTPGSNFSMDCGIGHWRLRPYDDSTEELRRYLESASECKDYARIKRW